jgi:hypothetical protein
MGQIGTVGDVCTQTPDKLSGRNPAQLDIPEGIFKIRAVSRDDNKVGAITEEFSRKRKTDAA